MKKIYLFLMSAILFLCSCSQEDMIAKFTPKQEDASARAYIQQLRERNFENIKTHLDPSIQTPSIDEVLEKMSAQFPEGEPNSIRVVGANTFVVNGIRKVNLTYEFEYPARWLLVNVATRGEEGNAAIIGFNVAPEKSSIANQNRFSLGGKSALHYVFLIAAIVAPLFTLITLVICIRTRPLRRKWLWIIGILFGLGQFGLNWTTGETFIHVVYVQLFSAGAFAAPFGPWILSVSIPFFSVMFWIKRRSLIRHAEFAKNGEPTDDSVAS